MALSVSNQVSPIASKLILQDDATATSDNNITSQAVTIYLIEIDNTAVGNASQANYLKLYNNVSPTVGTTAPDMCLMVTANTKRSYAFTEGILFGTGLSMACVTTPGTAGTTDPPGDVVVRILAS
jgi:SUMO ligase MMS21 Smc5/6 complex component